MADNAGATPPWVRALSLTGAFLALSVIWMFLLTVALGLLSIALASQAGLDLAHLTQDQLMDVMGPGVTALGSMAQTGGMVLIAAALASLLTGGPDEESAMARQVRVFALGASSWVALGLAAIGALTVGWFPGWIASTLHELYPDFGLGSLELISSTLLEGPLWGRATMVFAVVVGAPLFEELIFRGFLWKALEEAGGPWVALVVTTVLFAGYHLDPIHVVSILFTGAFLGWLRMASGSLWPAVLAHLVNNGLAVLVTLTTSPEADTTVPLAVALGGASFTIAIGAALWWYERRKAA